MAKKPWESARINVIHAMIRNLPGVNPRVPRIERTPVTAVVKRARKNTIPVITMKLNGTPIAIK